MNNVYRGWNIYFDRNYEIWHAKQYGVSMNHTEKEALLQMVDQHIIDRTQWFLGKEDVDGTAVS